MIILITGTFPIYRRGVKVGEEFVVSHGVDERTGRTVILPAEHPSKLGARFDMDIGEWVLPEYEPL
jgi:hypothetical protein